jgi:Uma2 family endonuclease
MEVLHSKLVDDAPFKRNAKYADLDLVPDTKIGELVDGNLYAHSRARTLHARAVMRLYRELDRREDDDDPSGWVVLADVEIWFGRNVLVPDLAAWRRRRMPEIPDLVTIRLTPDWVCEGLSPSTAWLDHGRKREIYAKHGVEHLWFADPSRRELEVLVLDGKSYRVTRTLVGNVRAKIAPFTHAIDLATLWKR